MNGDEIAALIGRSVTAEDVADPHRWRSYRAFLGLAEDTPALAFHWLLFAGIPPETRADGHARVMPPFPPLPWPRRMWAGGEVRWQMPPRAGERLTRSTRISHAELKQGGSGTFLLASLEHAVRGDAGASIDERQDVVFLPETARPGAAPPRPPAFDAEWEEAMCFGAVDLFRYSALTFNAHRIHYDADYARDVELYPGVVVHGPLLATRLIHAAVRRMEVAPAGFSYRAIAPSFAGEALRIIGKGEALAVVGPDGGMRMSATVT
jgi:3-methylfumaryl-CoA hydratase